MTKQGMLVVLATAACGGPIVMPRSPPTSGKREGLQEVLEPQSRSARAELILCSYELMAEPCTGYPPSASPDRRCTVERRAACLQPGLMTTTLSRSRGYNTTASTVRAVEASEGVFAMPVLYVVLPVAGAPDWPPDEPRRIFERLVIAGYRADFDISYRIRGRRQQLEMAAEWRDACVSSDSAGDGLGPAHRLAALRSAEDEGSYYLAVQSPRGRSRVLSDRSQVDEPVVEFRVMSTPQGADSALLLHYYGEPFTRDEIVEDIAERAADDCS